MCNKKYLNQGQIILELLWLIAFACAFLTALSFLYEGGQMEINKSRIIQLPKNSKHPSSFYRRKTK